MQGIAVNCLDKYSSGNSVSLELPASIEAANAAKIFNRFVGNLGVENVKCEKDQDCENGITITASDAELLGRALAKLSISNSPPKRGNLI